MYGQVLKWKNNWNYQQNGKKKTIPCPSCPVITSFFEFATFHKVFQFLVY